jgi:hypothetical protein
MKQYIGKYRGEDFCVVCDNPEVLKILVERITDSLSYKPKTDAELKEETGKTLNI